MDIFSTNTSSFLFATTSDLLEQGRKCYGALSAFIRRGREGVWGRELWKGGQKWKRWTAIYKLTLTTTTHSYHEFHLASEMSRLLLHFLKFTS
jgi:hypothetical protein